MWWQVLANSLSSAAGYVLVAVGFGIIYSTARFFHFAHGAVYAVGAYTAYFVCVRMDFGWWMGAACGVLSAAVCGGLLEKLIYRRLRRIGASPTILFLTSLGLLIAIQNVIALGFGDGALVLRRQVGQAYRLGGAAVTEAQIERVLLAITVTLIVWICLHLTRWGRQARATANDPELAEIVGAEPDRVRLIAFVVGSALAGLAAIVLAHDTDLHPNMGFSVLLVAVVAMVVGGVGSVPGTSLGCFLVALLQNLSVWLLPAQWGDAAAYALMIGFLLGRPRGVLGSDAILKSI